MKIFIERDIVCTNAEECSQAIHKALATDYPFEDGSGNRTSHFSVYHEPHFHKIWLFYYDNDGKHEQDVFDENTKRFVTITKNEPNVKKATKRPNNKNEVEGKIVVELMKNPNIIVK